jgi:hypothetical protein
MGEGHRIIIDLLQPDPSYLAVQWLFRKLLAGVYLLANFLHHLEHKETRKLLSLNISFKRFVLLAVSNRQISAHTGDTLSIKRINMGTNIFGVLPAFTFLPSRLF